MIFSKEEKLDVIEVQTFFYVPNNFVSVFWFINLWPLIYTLRTSSGGREREGLGGGKIHYKK